MVYEMELIHPPQAVSCYFPHKGKEQVAAAEDSIPIAHPLPISYDSLDFFYETCVTVTVSKMSRPSSLPILPYQELEFP